MRRGNRVQERITLRMTEARNYSYYPFSRLLPTAFAGLSTANGNPDPERTSFTITGDGIELKEESIGSTVTTF